MSSFKSIIWTIFGIVVFIAIIRFVGFILPYVLVAGLVAYIVYKVRKSLGLKNKKENNETYTSSYKQNNDIYEPSSSNEDYTGKVIDVDYEDVD